jgi:foldase protein PrsA
MLRLNKKWIAGALAIFLIASIVAGGCAATVNKTDKTGQSKQAEQAEFKPLSTTSKTVVAEFNGGKETEGELNRYINIICFLDPQLGMMMSSMKDKQNELKAELAKEYAARQYMVSKVKDDPKYANEADQTLKDIENGLKTAPGSDGKTPKNLDEAIKGKGFTKEELRSFFINYHKVNAYYDDQMKGQQYDLVKVQHILIAVGDGTQPGQPTRSDADAKKRAQEVEQKLSAGEDFAKLAKEYSDDPGSKDKGGIIEGAADQFVPEFANACRSLPINKVSDPVKTSYGYHIIKVLDRQKKPLSEAPDDVKSPKRQEIYDNLVKNELKFKSFLPQGNQQK